jgi:predicted transposase YbfD/YdcC
MLHMVSAWVREDGITIGQISTEGKSNEIKTIPKLIEQLDIRGGTVTTDAMGCQKAITKAVIAGEGQYVFAVKQNQPTLYEEIEEYFRWAIHNETEQHHLSRYTERDFGHGKIVQWHVTATKNTVWFETKQDWTALRSFVMVERTTEKGGNKHRECAYYISSLEADAAKFQRLVRGHWSIENQLHWILDCQFNEDACRIHKGNAPANLSLIRKMALALLKRDSSSKLSIRSKQKLAGWDNNFALDLIL